MGITVLERGVLLQLESPMSHAAPATKARCLPTRQYVLKIITCIIIYFFGSIRELFVLNACMLIGPFIPVVYFRFAYLGLFKPTATPIRRFLLRKLKRRGFQDTAK